MTPEQFKTARLAAGFATQEAIAEAFDLNRRTVGRWERGEVPVPKVVEIALMGMTSPSPAANPGILAE